MWRKDTGTLHGIYEGDGSVVNVIRAHPHLPLLAVSGIDTTIKVCTAHYRLVCAYWNKHSKITSCLHPLIVLRAYSPEWETLSQL